MLGPLAPNLARQQRPEAGVDLARSGGGRGLQGRSAGARPDHAAAGALHRRRRRVRARSRRRAGRCRRCCCMPAATAASPPRGSAAFAAAAPRQVVTAREFRRLFHEIFNEPEQARGVCGLAPAGAAITLVPSPRGARDERTRPAAAAATRRSRRSSPPSPSAPGTRRSSRRSPTTSPSRPRARCSTPTGSRTATSSAWCAMPPPGSRRKKVAGLKLEVIRLEGRTPVIFFEVPATKPAAAPATICLYGHLDKQPEFNGWRNDLGPWTPKYENGLLYGRGGADDGYAVYAVDHRDPGARRAGHPAPALRRPDRDLRGKRLVRPAGLRRRAAAAARRRRPRRLPRQRRRQLRPAVAHDQPARQRHRHAEGRDPHRRRALGRRQRPGAVELSHPAPGARPARGHEDRPAAAARASTARSRPTASSRRARPRRSWATRSGSASPGPAAPTAARRCRPPPTRSRRCSTAPGGRRSASPASTASRR